MREPLTGGTQSKRSALFLSGAPAAAQHSQILDLLADDSWLNVYAGELEVRPPGAPTIRPISHQGSIPPESGPHFGRAPRPYRVGRDGGLLRESPRRSSNAFDMSDDQSARARAGSVKRIRTLTLNERENTTSSFRMTPACD
jgi:hypothetical protein